MSYGTARPSGTYSRSTSGTDGAARIAVDPTVGPYAESQLRAGQVWLPGNPGVPCGLPARFAWVVSRPPSARLMHIPSWGALAFL